VILQNAAICDRLGMPDLVFAPTGHQLRFGRREIGDGVILCGRITRVALPLWDRRYWYAVGQYLGSHEAAEIVQAELRRLARRRRSTNFVVTRFDSHGRRRRCGRRTRNLSAGGVCSRLRRGQSDVRDVPPGWRSSSVDCHPVERRVLSRTPIRRPARSPRIGVDWRGSA
jgi:hypothetical protein